MVGQNRGAPYELTVAVATPRIDGGRNEGCRLMGMLPRGALMLQAPTNEQKCNGQNDLLQGFDTHA